MKNVLLIMMIGVLSFITSCNSSPKTKSWSAEQEKKWKTECTDLLTGHGTTKAEAEGYCDCMFQKTAEKYTPAQAAKLTAEQERKIWEEFAYSW